MSRKSWFVPLLLAASLVSAADPPEAERAADATEPQAQTPAQAPERKPAKTEEGPKLLDGMSVLGNQEAPKALVIVPWKTSDLGASLGLAPLLDDSRQPVDKEVFMRALSYYEIRSGTNAAQPATATRRSKS
jgi:hypothetical protein